MIKKEQEFSVDADTSDVVITFKVGNQLGNLTNKHDSFKMSSYHFKKAVKDYVIDNFVTAAKTEKK